MTLFDRIKTVTELQAVAGHERPVRDYLKDQLSPYVDDLKTDGLGGIFGIRRHADADAPTILVAAHMDEVGFLVSNIQDNGTLRVVPLGGWNPLVVSAQRFTLTTQKGEQYPVISGAVPPHLLRGTSGASLPKVEDIVFDAGFSDKVEAESYGVRPGDTIIPDSQTILTANDKNVISKAWDNRYGVLMVTELLRHLADTDLPNTLIAGANVQEEVGLRGAHASTQTFQPDIFLAVDCSPAGDVYGDQGAIGEGTLIRFYDPGHVLLEDMKDLLLETAEENGIRYQYYCGKGGTDAGAAHLQAGGVPSTTIGVCARYIHSHQTLFNLDDFQQAQAFLQALVKKLDRKTVDKIRGY